jgi:hypothetical protein
MTNPWYDKESKIAIKSIKDALDNKFLKSNKIIRYKTPFKMKKKKKVLYKNKARESLRLFKLGPKKFKRKIVTHKTKKIIWFP